jgi:prepilin-type N-terminal cleavage/methylation domain-containing protein
MFNFHPDAWRGTRNCRAGGAPSGFTLLELLVAISLLAVMLALLFGAFSQITGGAARVQEQVDEQQALRLVTGLIADDLAAAQHLDGLKIKKRATGIVAETEHIQRGEFTRIDFHAAVPARFHREVAPEQDPELHEIGYRVRESEDRQRLELIRREDFYLDEDLREGGIEAPLADHVKAFRVEFLGPRNPDASPAVPEDWRDGWNSADQKSGEELPRALRVTLTIVAKDGREIGETLAVNFPTDLRPTSAGPGRGAPR